MFNSHLYTTFDSVATLEQLRQHTPPSRPTVRDNSLSNEPNPKLPDPANLHNHRWSRVSDLNKRSYVPGRLSRLAGLRNYMETKAHVLIPKIFRHIHQKDKFFYLIPRNVTITYGPYHYLGILDYRLERLHGLETALTLAGANVHFRAVQHINHVSVWYLEKEIFTCKITDLHHGGDGEMDRRCYDAALAFAKKSRKVLRYIKNKYKFDKEKGSDMFKNCPCPLGDSEEDGEEGEEEEEEAEDYEEIHGEDEHDHDHEEEGEGSEVPLRRSSGRLPRIYFQPLSNRRLMLHSRKAMHPPPPPHYPEEEGAVEVGEEEVQEEAVNSEEYPGEDDQNLVDDGPKGGSLKMMEEEGGGVHFAFDVNSAYNRLGV